MLVSSSRTLLIYLPFITRVAVNFASRCFVRASSTRRSKDAITSQESIVPYEDGYVIITTASDANIRILVSSEVPRRTAPALGVRIAPASTSSMFAFEAKHPCVRSVRGNPAFPDVMLRVLPGKLERLPKDLDLGFLNSLWNAANKSDCVKKMTLVAEAGLHSLDIGMLNMSLTASYAAVAMKSNLAWPFRTATRHLALHSGKSLMHILKVDDWKLSIDTSIALEAQRTISHFAIHTAVTGFISTLRLHCGCRYTPGHFTMTGKLQLFLRSPLIVGYNDVLNSVKNTEFSYISECEDHA
ncbi:hypothetical protein K461DRAFT_68049 [Myriangium duriaei CBS 260.36]|uniref:Uncharacterized protein n=1 Tax=Myriangium duriaei CBS 260.36 TaxID=1168546 RepID=A0A9P4MCC6_9PEZI|nr:hypothetical protein K461DRAFT_68049 [Myriangium duriaei CBS 260.36]